MLSGRKCKYLRTRLFVFAIAMMQITFVAGCGYHFTPGGEYIDKSIQTVFVENFSNKTSEANIENTFRGAFIDQFIKGRRLRLTERRGTADAVLKGKIENLVTSPLSYNSASLTAEERITVSIQLSLEEQSSQKVLWSDKNISGTEDYPFTDLATKEQNKKQALIKLANDTAERAYRLIMSGF